MFLLKSTVNRWLGHFGYEIRRRRNTRPLLPIIRSEARASFREGLAQVRDCGWSPATVLDVGGAHGNFTRACYDYFPQARYLVVEPLTEFRVGLLELMKKIPNSILATAAAGKLDGTTTLHVHRDWDGSSLYRETEGSHVDGVERTVPMRSLDSLVREYRLPAPYLLKVDVQGAELDVLAGGSETLRVCEYVLLEVAMFQFFVGGPRFEQVVDFMHTRGFSAYDIFGLLYRPIDNALAQIDLAFVQTDGPFRQVHSFATREQRAAQDRLFDVYHKQHSTES